jgi:hypothetical protein
MALEMTVSNLVAAPPLTHFFQFAAQRLAQLRRHNREQFLYLTLVVFVEHV